jgi:transcription elongation factor GreA
MPVEILMTAEGYEQLKRELDDLRTVKRKEISDKIRTARGFGDLSENEMDTVLKTSSFLLNCE